ncbi:MAG: heme lyase CcmF/NrfE family subunit [Actinobacteria bacterium]|nr:heme lyase CcmF/NrfE family subunit [Actinomycetota bacterium]
MKAQLGVLGIALGIGATAVGMWLLALGLRRKDVALLQSGRRCVYLVSAAAVVAVVAMEWALLSHDFTIRYVAENNARSTPWLFTVTGLWAALEGSILLWALILGGYLAFMAYRYRDRVSDPMVGWALLVALSVALFFFCFMAFAANPFELVNGDTPVDGRGPNPLLQNHPLMALHPPMLYLGYVGMTVPFSFAIAALVTGRFSEGWLADTRRTTLVAWGFLTAGIVLGAWWSYEVLGWGGYWAWDPVENASLLPWLTATAFIHSVMVQERRGMLRVWNLSLVIATFCLTILGTFLTRSGVVNSVHAFTESDIGPWLLGYLALVAAVGLGLIAWRADQLHSSGRIDAVVSGEAAFLANNLLFTGLAFVVLLGTVFPLVAEALSGSRLSVGEPYFDRMTTPLGLALLFLMAVAPALPWQGTTGEVLRRRLLVPAYLGVFAMVATLLLLTRDLVTALAFGLGAFAVAGIVREVGHAVATRRRADAVGRAQALGRTVLGNPRRYGGLVVHVGVVMIALALAAAGSFGTKREVRLRRGESATVGGYTLTFTGTRTSRSAQKTTVAADLAVRRGGRSLGTYAPAVSTFPNSTQGIGTPSVRTGLVEDLYLTLVSSPNARGRVTVNVSVQPMTLWIWLGGSVMALGTLVALTPSVRRRPARVEEEAKALTVDGGRADERRSRSFQEEPA